MNAKRVIELATINRERRRIGIQVRKMEHAAFKQDFNLEYCFINHLNHFFKYYCHGITNFSFLQVYVQV